MKKSRIVVALILNLLVIAAVVFGFLNHYFLGLLGTKAAFEVAEVFKWYTNDTALLLAFVSLLLLIEDFVLLSGKKPCKFLAILELVAVTGSMVTCITVAAYLAPTYNTWEIVYGPDYYLYVHTVAPILGLIAFIVANRPRIKWYAAFLGIILPVVYAGVMIPMILMGVIPEAPYPFLDVAKNDLVANIIAGAIGVVGPFIIALIAILLHNIGSKEEAPAIAPAEEETKEEAAPAPAPEEAKPAESKPEEAKPKEAKPEETKPEEAGDSSTRYEGPYGTPATPSRPAARVYRVKKSGSKWQVILVGAENKVVKSFDTQTEAIAYSRGLLESRGKMVRVTKVKKK